MHHAPKALEVRLKTIAFPCLILSDFICLKLITNSFTNNLDMKPKLLPFYSYSCSSCNYFTLKYSCVAVHISEKRLYHLIYHIYLRKRSIGITNILAQYFLVNVRLIIRSYRSQSIDQQSISIDILFRQKGNTAVRRVKTVSFIFYVVLILSSGLQYKADAD